MLFYRAAAATIPQGPHRRGRDHPAAPRANRVVLAEAESRGAGSASARLTAQRRDVRRAADRVQGRHRHGLEIRKRYRRPARGPRPEAPQGDPGRQEGRVRLRGGGRDPDPHPRCRRGPALLLRQAQDARDEPSGLRQPRRRPPVGVGALPGSVLDKKAEWIRGVLAELEARGPGHPGRQGLPEKRVREDPAQGEEQS
jgi:hypothetical protein